MAEETRKGSAKRGIAEGRGERYAAAMKPAIDPKLLENPLFRELMAEGLAMQERFVAEPVYAKTGKGFLKSEGVEELQRIKKAKKSAAK